jgi:hypothetical protein
LAVRLGAVVLNFVLAVHRYACVGDCFYRVNVDCLFQKVGACRLLPQAHRLDVLRDLS